MARLPTTPIPGRILPAGDFFDKKIIKHISSI
jgi:hypothetical protein